MQDGASPDVPLYEQIYNRFRTGIESGTYPAGSRLPSIRGLANDIGCSRNTAESAYRLLVQEGYALSRPGSGYVVQDVHTLTVDPDASSRPRPMRTAVKNATGAETDPQDPVRYDFTYRDLEPGTFPLAGWRSITDNILMGDAVPHASAYPDPNGIPVLREEIAWRLNATRNMQCAPEQVIIQNGLQPAMQNLLALFDPARDTVAVEEPGYVGARRAVARASFSIAACRVSSGNAFMSDLENAKARLVYVTPSSQFPLGTVMTIEKRKQLLAWAKANDAYILEDDYCRDCRYKDRPVAPLFSLDEGKRVVYFGTFSKSLSPALRIGYLVLPTPLLDRWNERFADAYAAVPWITQAALAEFMRSGMWNRHLRRMQARNRRKYEALSAALARHLGDRVSIVENGTGMHILAEVLDGRSQDELIAVAKDAGVRVYETNCYWTAKEHPLASCVLIGFSRIREADIEPGIAALAKAWFPES